MDPTIIRTIYRDSFSPSIPDSITKHTYYYDNNKEIIKKFSTVYNRNIKFRIKNKIKRTLFDYNIIINSKNQTIFKLLTDLRFFQNLIRITFKKYPDLIESVLKLDEVKEYLGTTTDYKLEYEKIIVKLSSILEK